MKKNGIQSNIEFQKYLQTHLNQLALFSSSEGLKS